MAYGLITTGSLLKGFFEKKKDRPHIPYEKAREIIHAKPDLLQIRKDRRDANIAREAEKKYPSSRKPPISLQQRIRAKKGMGATLGRMPSQVMTTPKARAKEREFYQRNVKRKMDEGATSALEKRCVSDVVKKGKTVSQAYAICRSSLQKSGRIEKGGMELTKLGKTISDVKTRKSDHVEKIKAWKKAIVKARRG